MLVLVWRRGKEGGVPLENRALLCGEGKVEMYEWGTTYSAL